MTKYNKTYPPYAPFKPFEPSKTMEEWKTVFTFKQQSLLDILTTTLGENFKIKLHLTTDELSSLNNFVISCENDDEYSCVVIQQKILSPNKDYDRQYKMYLKNLEKYEKEFIKYKKDLKDYNERKQLIEDKIKKAEEEKEIKIYKKLHKKYKDRLDAE